MAASGKGQLCHQLPFCPWDLPSPCHLGRARTQDHGCDLASYILDKQAEYEAFSILAPEVSGALEGIVQTMKKEKASLLIYGDPGLCG